jgi:hypothetical protein
MSFITNGKVTYGRTVKTGDYENKRVDVEIVFVVPDGANAEDAHGYLGDAGIIAFNKAHELLGLADRKAISKPQPVTLAATTQEPTTSPVATAPAPAATTRRGPKKPPVVEVSVSTKEIEDQVEANRANISASPEDRNDPAGFTDENPTTEQPQTTQEPSSAPEAGDEHATAAVEGNDPAGFGDDDWGAAPADITEADLVAACAKKQQQTGNGIAIKQVIGKYVKPPKSVKEIPQELRQKFLDELAKL